ncbi:MAG: polysaccharide pyruvyl transferase family protein [Microbacterium sp.]|uniref:polysaccharide pyruvyl transferase family protein n=1 Tax=Microbacterium sp. TaxID=51671 RepID=UPI0039E577D0
MLVLHAYSAENAGDGLLVHETLALVREALGDAAVTMLAIRPETFSDLDVTVLRSTPSARGWDAGYRHALRTIDDFDLVVAVGGGYLRAGTPVETVKMLLTHALQLRAAARTRTPTIYLPQSIGPARYGLRRPLRHLLGKVDSVMLRDDRSVQEVGGPTSMRVPDLATAAVADGRHPGQPAAQIPVLSIRAVHGKVSPAIYDLAEMLGTYDGYVQSTTGGNDDRPAAATLTPRTTLAREKLMNPGGQPRVVIAVRLHAALMALAAGHYVIHLAYERKGFGAFGDLGLSDWVHSVNNFDALHVHSQANALLDDPGRRDKYDAQIATAAARLADARGFVIGTLRDALNARK